MSRVPPSEELSKIPPGGETLDPRRSRSLRILLLCEGNAESRDSWSGISKSVVDQLRAAGHQVIPGDVDLYGLRRLLVGLMEFSPNRRRWWVKYHLNRRPFLARSRNAERLLRKHRGKFDVILQFGATFRPAGRGNVPFALYCDGNIILSKKGAVGGQSEAAFLEDREIDEIRGREQEVYAGASRIMTISERLRRSFAEDFQIPSDRLRTVYAGPNFDLSRIPELCEKTRREGPPTVLFIGRQFQRKGGDVLLKAFRTVRNRVPEARLVIIGPRDLEVDQPGVEVLGHVDKDTPSGWAAMKSAFETADVFCMPTRFEGLSISFLEAMFFGLPCISTYTPWSPPEMIKDGETGFVVPMDNADALAERMVQLLRDRDLARRMGLAGRWRAEETFTWESVARKMVSELLAATTSG